MSKTPEHLKAQIKSAMEFDPIQTARQMQAAGIVSDKKGEIPFMMLLSMSHNKKQEKLLKEANDSFWGMSYDAFLNLAYSMGFMPIYTFDFKTKWEHKKDKAVYMWHESGVLLTAESFGQNLNMSRIYFNSKKCPSMGSSGSVTEKGIFVRDIDVREGLRQAMEDLEGHLLKKWVECPHLWLLTHGDTENKSFDSKAINKERLSHFPKEIQKAINYKK